MRTPKKSPPSGGRAGENTCPYSTWSLATATEKETYCTKTE
ncbi:hypothetical protein [Rubritalea tangerina]